MTNQQFTKFQTPYRELDTVTAEEFQRHDLMFCVIPFKCIDYVVTSNQWSSNRFGGLPTGYVLASLSDIKRCNAIPIPEGRAVAIESPKPALVLKWSQVEQILLKARPDLKLN